MTTFYHIYIIKICVSLLPKQLSGEGVYYNSSLLFHIGEGNTDNLWALNRHVTETSK
jgi:hypothetical protein